MAAWLGKMLGAVLAYVGPLLLAWIAKLVMSNAAKRQQDEASKAMQSGDTLAFEEAINSPLAGTPSGIEGAGLRARPPVEPKE